MSTTEKKEYPVEDAVSDHRQDDDVSETNDSEGALANAPWQYKALALVTALLLPLGSHFSSSALSAMKSTLKKELAINNTQYGILSSSVSIINTFFPIVGGFAIDMFGTLWGTLAVNLVVILGSLLTALACQYDSYPLIVVGRVVFGIGSGLIVTMQETLLSKWFRTSHLAIALGLQLSISRLATFLGTLVANPLAQRAGWVWPFWLSFILCGFSVGMNIIYGLIVKKLQGQFTTNTKTDLLRLKAKKTFHFRSVLLFPAIFWLIILIEFIYAAVWSSFQTISTEFVQIHFGSSAVLAGYQASTSDIVPIVLTPVLGIFMDVFGLRTIILLLSSVFLILSTGLLGWTYANPVGGMVMYSVSLACGPIAMISSISMILPSDYIGTGLGLYKASNNIGTSILTVVIGVLQDDTANQAYTGVMIVFLALACVGFLLNTGLWFVQFRWYDNLLDALRRKRIVLMEERNSHELERTRKGLDALSEHTMSAAKLYTRYFYVGVFVAAFITAWVLFFVYSITGSAGS